MWALGVLAYAFAVFNRTSLGVAGSHAAERFAIGATTLAWFAVLQLLVYAILQLPAGVLVDRFHPRRVLTCALMLMGAGQLLLSVATTAPVGIAARVLLGCGDALTFVSVLRLIVAWCAPSRVALLVQLTATLGMIGNLASAAPLLTLLDGTGWGFTFLLIAAMNVLCAGTVFAVVRDSADGSRAAGGSDGFSLRSMMNGVAFVWRIPLVRAGFWMHFTASFPWMSFVMLWGVPFLTEARGVSPTAASGLLTVLVLSNMAASPLFGHLAGKRPGSRPVLHSWVIALVALTWAVVLSWPGGSTPVWMLGILTAVLGLCGPASMLGMDVARTAGLADQTGTASAAANMGGFAGSLVAIVMIGVVLDVGISAGLSRPAAFDLAFAGQFLLIALGSVQKWRYARRAARGGD